MTLLRAEIKDFREANEILSQRRKEKKKCLCNEGVMTVEEGQASIDQTDVNIQIATESSMRGGQGESTQPRERRCGVCGKPGYNIRTCKADIPASGD
jgi:hypothetical protein